MQNIKELRESLIENYNLMKAGEMQLKTGKELSSCAGKILNSLKVELDYNKHMGRTLEIEFLDSETETQ